jgi:DNA-binding NtrC family response regulator
MAQPPTSVLVVDDEPVVLEVFSRVLGEKGIETRTASSAEEALALLEQNPFACVLADKNMPGMDGIEMIRRVRESQPNCACILMTGYASTESAIEALRLGAADYLEKPFEDFDAVAARIEDAIRTARGEATEELRARCLQLLSRLVASKGAGRQVLLSGERILDEVRRLRRSQSEIQSAELGEIERLLEEHLTLARLAQSR